MVEQLILLVRPHIPAEPIAFAPVRPERGVGLGLAVVRSADYRYGEDLPPVETSVVELDFDPAGEVGGGAEGPAGRLHRVVLLLQVGPLDAVRVEAEVRRGHRPAFLPGQRSVGRRPVHAQRLEDHLVKQVLPRHARLAVEDEAEDVVAEVGVGEGAARRLTGFRGIHRLEQHLGRMLAAEGRAKDDGVVAQGGRVGDQVAQRDAVGLDRRVEIDHGQIVRQRGVEVEVASGVEERRRQRRKRLRRGGDVEERLGRGGYVSLAVGYPEAAQVHRLVAVDHGYGDAWHHADRVERLGDERVGSGSKCFDGVGELGRRGNGVRQEYHQGHTA